MGKKRVLSDVKLKYARLLNVSDGDVLGWVYRSSRNDLTSGRRRLIPEEIVN